MLVLLAAAWQQNAAAFATTPLLTLALALMALISARIFWAIPAGIDDETPLTALRFDWNSFGILLDKLLVMHNYYANLWSFFGSRALHAAQLAFDLTLTLVLAIWIRRRSALS
jgi:hypothetical protein